MPINFTSVNPLNPQYRRVSQTERAKETKFYTKPQRDFQQQSKKDDKGHTFHQCLEDAVERLDVKI